MSYAEKLRDPRWQRKRTEILQRDNFTCRDCGSDSKTLHVHHCHYQRGCPWETDSRLMLTLCEECHGLRQTLENECREQLGIIFSTQPFAAVDTLRRIISDMARMKSEGKKLHVEIKEIA